MRVLVITALLGAWVGTALADATWVLWDQSVYSVDGQEPAVLWSDWGSFTTKGACEAKRRDEVGPYEYLAEHSPNEWSKQGDGFVQKDNGKVLKRITYYCYPATTNPRWQHIAAQGDWYLMGPPRSAYKKRAAYLLAYDVLVERPLSEWNLLDAFESREVCEIMRGSLRNIEESTYKKAAAHYLQMMSEQQEPVLSFQRFIVETDYANVKTYTASRCVHRADPALPNVLKKLK